MWRGKQSDPARNLRHGGGSGGRKALVRFLFWRLQRFNSFRLRDDTADRRDLALTDSPDRRLL